MKNFIIYLAGKCKGLTEKEQNNWRRYVKNKLEHEMYSPICKISAINPNDYFGYFDQKHKTNKQVKRYFMSLIDKSNVVLVNLNNSADSVGTGQELQYAVDHNIPIIGFGTDNMYPWEVEEDCQVVFDDIDDAIEYVRRYYVDLYT